LFDSIALIAKHRDFHTESGTAPYGACRQMLFESAQLADYNMEIILSNTDMSNIMITSIYELLPEGFGPKNLKVNLSEFKSK
ncbi:MAG: hypothetical protein KAS39_06640, partial [Actinomycetia bacterium]|nr:hypothetical protein [Actinomycetes bacterium]